MVMLRKRKSFNSKRRIVENPSQDVMDDLANRVHYGGNPEHKRNPGDFGLTPPACPRPDKTLCDGANITKKSVALKLLRDGVRRGLVSERNKNGFPQNVWAVTGQGIPVEAQLENSESGTYHGYPMALGDPFRDIVLEKWNSQNE